MTTIDNGVNTTDASDSEEALETPATQTIREFFVNLPVLSFVRATRTDTEYIFRGFAQNSDGYEVPQLVHSRYMSEFNFAPSALDSDNVYEPARAIWEVVEFTDEGRLAALERALRHALRQLASTQQELTSMNAVASETSKECINALQDIKAINEHINAYAMSQQWCGDYERRITGWNNGVDGQPALTNKLVGRLRTYVVPVRIPAIQNGEISVGVEARTAQEAREIVQTWTPSAVMKGVLEYGWSLNELQVLHETTDEFGPVSEPST